MTVPSLTMLQRTLVLSVLLALCFCAGCRSYQLGHPAELPFETLYIEPAKNDSFAPQAQALVSSEVREAVIRDGRVKLTADRAEADAVLTMNLTEYIRNAASRRQDDTEVAQSYDLKLLANLDLYDPNSGDYFFQGRKLNARTTGYIENPYAPAGIPKTQGLIQSEYNAMPRLARELGRKAADEVLSAW